jgi:hypothetical protein
MNRQEFEDDNDGIFENTIRTFRGETEENHNNSVRIVDKR